MDRNTLRRCGDSGYLKNGRFERSPVVRTSATCQRAINIEKYK